jgi:putative flippase GtrA
VSERVASNAPSRSSAASTDAAVVWAQFIRFGLVGVLNTCFGYTAFAIVYLAVGDENLAVILATMVGATFNFFTIGRLVFRTTLGPIARFAAGYAMVCGYNIVALKTAMALGAGPLPGQIASLPTVVAVSFIVNKFWVFRR